MTTRQICVVGALCWLTWACTASNSDTSLARSLESEIAEYLRLAAALGARDADSIDYAYAPSSVTAAVMAHPPPFPIIRARAMAAADRVAAIPDSRDAPRRRSLAAQLRAVAARADLLAGHRTTFDVESRALFGVELPVADEATGRPALDELEGLLPGRGSLPERFEAFERRQLVPADKARSVFDRALEGCRRHSPATLTLPNDEAVDVAVVRNTPWNAYSRYHGRFRSTIQINLEAGFTVDAALTLACHEGYPGHHVQNVLTEARLVGERRFNEFTIQPLFSPQTLLAEALAVRAIDLAFPGDTRAAFARDVLYPITGLDSMDAARSVAVSRALDRLRLVTANIARSYLDGDLEFVRAGSALTARALVTQPEPLLKFLNRFRSYAVTYTYGPDWLEARDARDDDPRTALLATLLSPQKSSPTKTSLR